MRVLAVDPGGTTGWAIRKCANTVSWGQIPGGTVPAAHGLSLALEELVGARDIVQYRETVLVIERYTISERTTKYSRQADALKITGALELAAWRLGVPVVFQQPSEAKRLFTDDRLRQFGWYARGEEHARDALRHLGFYLARKRLIRLTDRETVDETEVRKMEILRTITRQDVADAFEVPLHLLEGPDGGS